MSKVAHYLQEHLLGEVITSSQARKYFATDASICTITPAFVLYPRNENDVRKAARFTWQLAERGRTIPITARGLGTSQTGAAIGSGIVMVYPAHMNRILELDGKTGAVTIEPGISCGKLQQTLYTHGRFLPPIPMRAENTTIGGAIATNSGGEKSVKYGVMGRYVKGLRVVLANGEIIATKRLAKRELSKKLGLSTFEGEIYRTLDTLLEENQDTVKSLKLGVTKNSAGYALADIRHKDGSFDLTPLFVGSEGTLGLITEATLDSEIYNPATTLIAAYIDDFQVAEEILAELRKLPEGPSAVEMVDGQLLGFIDQYSPNQLKGVIDKPFPKLVLLIEFDNSSARLQKRMVKKTQKLLKHYQVTFQTETEEAGQQTLWKIRDSATSVITHTDSNLRAVPFIEDAIVPVERFNEYLGSVYALLAKHHLMAGVWGHAGDGNLRLQPFLDISQIGDRQKLFRLMDEYYDLVIGLGGSTSAGNGDGRVRSSYLPKLYGDDAYELFEKVKLAFDPYGTLNPGVKVGTNIESLKPLLRYDYSVEHLYDHLPRS
ncbi:MAG TPA: FAD-binding oxidoreductase [Patescibacteria group bacterium]|nr:FAD-binding oxidoreductase [Patescibacteria group bacterium]